MKGESRLSRRSALTSEDCYFKLLSLWLPDCGTISETVRYKSLSSLSCPPWSILSAPRAWTQNSLPRTVVKESRAQLSYCDMLLVVTVTSEPGQPKWKVVEWNHVPWSVRRCGSGQKHANGLAKQTKEISQGPWEPTATALQRGCVVFGEHQSGSEWILIIVGQLSYSFRVSENLHTTMFVHPKNISPKESDNGQP